MRRVLGLGLALLLLAVPACNRAANEPETFSVKAKPTGSPAGYLQVGPIPLVAGQVNRVEITVFYKRSERPAAKLKYKVELSAPKDLKVTTVGRATSWEVEESLTTKDAGYTLSQTILVEVPANAAPGEREVTVTVIPESAKPVPSTLKFKVGG